MENSTKGLMLLTVITVFILLSLCNPVSASYCNCGKCGDEEYECAITCPGGCWAMCDPDPSGHCSTGCGGDCTPGETNKCINKGFWGTQTCNDEGHWGDCAKDEPENPVPELPTIVLFSIGLIALAGYVGLRRRKNN